MLIVQQNKLTEFAKNHANARQSLTVWKMITERAVWKNKQQVLSDFPNAKMIKNNRARFEIVHNAYRIIAQLNYDHGIVEIRFIGTHNEYEKIDPETI